MEIVIEIAIILLFLLCLYNAKKSSKELWLIFLGLIYAIIFENLNVILSAGKTGGYVYSSNFNIFIWNVPLFVSLAWAILIYVSYKLVNISNIKESRRPFADAVFITLIDIALDPFATRLGLWDWNGYGLTDGFFGVAGNNFLGWLLVSFVFMFLFRKFIDLKKKYNKVLLVFTPIIAYLGFILIFSLITFVEKYFGISKTGEVFLFFLLFILFICLMKKNKIKKGGDSDIYFIYFIRGLFYLFALYGLIYLGSYYESKNLAFILFAVIISEIIIYLEFVRPNV